MPARDKQSEKAGATRDIAWHALDVDEVESTLETGAEGISAQEAESRLSRDGPNELPEEPPPSATVVLLRQFRSPLIYILLVAAVVTVVVGEYVDAGVISAVVMLNAAIGFFQERKADESVRALMGLVSPHARVVRDGKEVDVESRDVALGEVVLLGSGDRVPADLRLAGATALRIDESLLTGESVPVGKQAAPVEEEAPVQERGCMAYMGTIVSSGRGRGYVVATGTTTELGQIAESVREETLPETPMQRRMAKFAKVVAAVIVAAAVVAFAVGVLYLGRSITQMFLVGVALAVAAIPEGLPVVFTITLALGVRRMARRRAIIRRLPAVETLGSTTVIGSDKTGTMTENRMTVQQVWAGGNRRKVDVDGEVDEPARMVLLAGVLTNEAEIDADDEDGAGTGDPTERALLVAASRLGVDPSEVRQKHPPVAEIPFESERRYSAAVREMNGEHALFVKGAPEKVLSMSAEALTDDGPAELDVDGVEKVASEMAEEGLRVLGMAYRVLPERLRGREPEVPEPDELVFLGLQAMWDPPREGVRDAIAGCRDAGIRVVMITGDHALTARAISRVLGIGEEDPEVLSGAELEDMDDDELREKVRSIPIYARVSPEHKLRVVQALRHHGEVVAVTGDGVNDAPALKAADIGVAMGKSGTDVAREASDMVLTDDNFVSIHAAVEEGRVTFDNVRKVTFFLISSGAAEIMAILTALALGWPLPFLPAQVLWLNLLTNGLQDVALAFEPGEPGVLKRPPRRKDEGVISRLLWERTAVAGLVMAAGTLVLFRWTLDHGASIEQARSVALTTMVLFQNFHVGNARSEHRSVFRLSPFSNPLLLLAVLAALGIHTGALFFGPTQFVLRVEPIPTEAWVRMVAVAVTIVGAMELHKFVRRRMAEES